jgi:hypothetical protein
LTFDVLLPAFSLQIEALVNALPGNHRAAAN